MKLLPSLDCRLQTERTAGEIGVILKSVTISGNRSFTASRQGEFTGNIDDTEFRLVSNSRNRNSFLPVIKGKLLTNGNKTEICIRMRMHPLVSAFMVVWMWGVLFSPDICGGILFRAAGAWQYRLYDDICTDLDAGMFLSAGKKVHAENKRTVGNCR